MAYLVFDIELPYELNCPPPNNEAIKKLIVNSCEKCGTNEDIEPKWGNLCYPCWVEAMMKFNDK